MNGAESLVRTLVAARVDTCFANPGTSEMHGVGALDRVDGMRCVLGLHETVVTAAADGYGRMTDRPACTLLHLGPGLANGLSNLHNARRAHSPIVNLVGEHTTAHQPFDAPLASDIEAIARSQSGWVRTSRSARSLAPDAADAVAAALRLAPNRIATLIAPSDCAWDEADGVAPLPPVAAPEPIAPAALARAVRLLRNGVPTTIVVGGRALRAGPLADAGRIAALAGARLFCPYGTARIERGAGRVPVERIPFVVGQAVELFAGVGQVILVEAARPVSFFGYPGKPNVPTRPDCEILSLAAPGQDGPAALAQLVEALGAGRQAPRVEPLAPPAAPAGRIDLPGIAAAIGSVLPENAIVVDESATTGRGFQPITRGAPPHDWLFNPGGSIGMGLPLAAGAAVACPGRRVLCLEGDGSGMYSPQALWTMAREQLAVTTVVFANRSYAILKGELANVGASAASRKALDMLEIGRPDIDWCGLARSLGVPASRADTLDGLVRALQAGLRADGPTLIELAL